MMDENTDNIRLFQIIVHEEKGDALQFDFDVHWDGNCNISLKADYIGSFGVERVKLFGRICVLLAPLIQELPVVSAIQYAFINPPTLELDFTGLANVADCSLLDTKIRSIIQNVLQGMMVLPNRMMVKMDPTNDFLDTYRPPVAIARITAIRGSGFKVQNRSVLKADIPDVYCKFQLGGKEWKTRTIRNSSDPEWKNDEAGDFVVFDHDQVICVDAWDEDAGTLDGGDDHLGSSKVTVGEVILAGKTVTVDLHGGEYRGATITLRCDVCKLTSNLDSLKSNANENLLSGFLTILVTKAENLPVEKEEASSFIKIKYGDQFEFVTPTVAHAQGIDALNPVYDSAFHVQLTPKLVSSKHPIEFQLINGTDTVLGTTSLTYDDLVKAKEAIVTENRKIGDGGASFTFRASIQGVEQPSDAEVPTLTDDSADKAKASSSSVTSGNALGTVRLTACKGWGFVAEKRRLHRKDIPDVYCNITFGSSPNIWRTSTIKNSLTPEWNESSDYLLSNHGQMITITAFDEDKGADKDDELGAARITVGKLLLEGGSTDVELLQDGKPTGIYVSVRCEMV
jgi:Ca2+-dependent lipid-binding protein